MRWVDRVNKLRIKVWCYIERIDTHQRVHIGPMADQWREVMELGDGHTIDAIDANGVLLKCIQELSAEIAELRKRVNDLTKEKANV